VFIDRIRAVLIGGLALLALGSLGASAAYAEAGPFWHHRAVGEKGEGTKIEEKAPEIVKGKSGEQSLESLVGGTKIIVVSPRENPFEDRFFNITWQGQIEQTAEWSHPELAQPSLKGCEININKANQVKYIEHLAWKWNGTKKQLELKPQVAEQGWDLVVLPEPMNEGETKLPGGTFATVALSGEGCGVLAGKYVLKGNLSAIPNVHKTEEWSTAVAASFPGWKQQHIWNGKEFIGVEPGLALGESSATLKGTYEAKTAQELAVFEK
jgi:hypothetical protein